MPDTHNPVKGNAIEFEWGTGVAIPGIREKGIALNGEAVDVSSDDDNGWRALLDVSAEDQVDITISGVTKSRLLKKDWFAGTRTKEVTITYPNGDTLVGEFYMANYTDTGNYKDAVTFEATLQSTGAVVFTPTT